MKKKIMNLMWQILVTTSKTCIYKSTALLLAIFTKASRHCKDVDISYCVFIFYNMHHNEHEDIELCTIFVSFTNINIVNVWSLIMKKYSVTS